MPQNVCTYHLIKNVISDASTQIQSHAACSMLRSLKFPSKSKGGNEYRYLNSGTNVGLRHRTNRARTVNIKLNHGTRVVGRDKGEATHQRRRGNGYC